MSAPTSISKPPRLTTEPGPLLRFIASRSQSLLTALCGAFLLLSLVPHLQFVAYASICLGSYFAVMSAAASIKHRRVDVNILMVLAAVGAVLVGRPQDAAALLFLFSLSGALEALAMAKTKSAISKLIQLRPTTALRISDGEQVRVPVESLELGDLMLIPPFEKLPTDGEVDSGSGSMDESAITGESLPVEKVPGSVVAAGTQNLDSTLTVRVTRKVGDSTLDQIIALVGEAQENKASGERISSWFGERYTVFVVGAFFLAWLGRSLAGVGPQESFYAALTLLVGLSPCALVISTPASTLSALTKAARRGMLVRGGEFIEKLGNIETVAFDKTGTLTTGKLRLHGMAYTARDGGTVHAWAPGETIQLSGKKILACVAATEANSTHPVARAIVSSAQEAQVPLPTAEEGRTLPGLGVEALVNGDLWAVGSDRLMASRASSYENKLEKFADMWRADGKTTVYASGPGGEAVLSFGDSLRAEAREAIQSLHQLGVKRVVMITGDKRAAAETIASQAGVDELHSDLMPADKTELVQALEKSGRVIMVGDGVNDAPSLASATVGIAMGSLGSDVAIEAADVVLMHDDLRRIPELVRLGRRTKGIIQANLALACGVIVSLAIASFVTKLPLPIAVLGHEGSTVIVILNGLRLLR